MKDKKSLIRLKRVSVNWVWLRVKVAKFHVIFGSVYIPPESSSFSGEDTWSFLFEETYEFKKLFPADLFLFLSDFNANICSSQEPL